MGMTLLKFQNIKAHPLIKFRIWKALPLIFCFCTCLFWKVGGQWNLNSNKSETICITSSLSYSNSFKY
jgi:hypothetical protein